MEGKVCVVTGASSGIGKEIARGLARQGASVVMVCRDPARGRRAVRDVGGDVRGSLDVALADLASQTEVRELAGELRKRHERIDVLVNNAGVFRVSRSTTVDGMEETFAVNHLAPFLLTNLLLDRLRAGGPARIVTVASEMHRGTALDLDDLQCARRYNGWLAYSRSKLANIMFTYALARRLEGTDVTATCVHPGFVATNLGRGRLRFSLLRLARPFLRGPARGADTAVWLASSGEVAGISGRYFDDRRERRSSAMSDDEELQEALWRASAEMVGLS